MLGPVQKPKQYLLECMLEKDKADERIDVLKQWQGGNWLLAVADLDRVSLLIVVCLINLSSHGLQCLLGFRVANHA